MGKLLDQASEEMQAEKYDGFKPKPVAGYPKERLQWLWPDMIARGIFHVFAGDSGIGKTLLLCDITATISRGGIFPGQREGCPQGKVIYLSGEDAVSHTLGPRLEAAGATLENVIMWPTTNKAGKQFNLDTDITAIQQYIDDNLDVLMLIIDPVTAFCGGRFDNDSVTSVRHITTKLNELSEKSGVAVIALQHLTKSENPKIKNRILGSGAWVHGPRIVLGAVHTTDGYRLFGKVKANVTDEYGVYPFNINSKSIPDIEDVRYIEWNPEWWWNNALSEFDGCIEHTDSKSQLAYDIIREKLSDGEWRRKKWIVQKVQSVVDVSDATLKRVAKELNIESRRTSETPSETEWRIPQSAHKRKQ